MSLYIASLKTADAAAKEAQRAERERFNMNASTERLRPLSERLKRLIESLPAEDVERGLSLPQLQRVLRGRQRSTAHAGEIGAELRRLGFSRQRRWQGDAGFHAVWCKKGHGLRMRMPGFSESCA